MIINNELEHAELMLTKGFQYKKNVFLELLILSKYLMFHKSMDKDQVSKEIHNYCSERLEGYNKDVTSKLINKVIKVALTSTLKVVTEIPITQLELNAIRELNDLPEEKIAFVMLVVYKLNRCYPFKISMDELFELANLRMNSTNRLKIIHSLTLKKKINSNQRLKRWVTFADKDGDASMSVVNFKQIVMYYLQWRGEPIINCEGCNKFITKTSNRKKYCTECSKEKHNEAKLRSWNNNKDVYRNARHLENP